MIKPLPGYVLIEPIEDETKSGQVYMPETSKDKPSKGKIIAISNWREWKSGKAIDWKIDNKYQLFTNQIVFYKKWVNQEVKHEGKEYLLVHFNELLAIIE